MVFHQLCLFNIVKISVDLMEKEIVIVSKKKYKESLLIRLRLPT